jgi:hypothetical protein
VGAQAGECVWCPPGYECKGGAEVWRCPLAAWSPGNASSCRACGQCAEITASRCNSTHDSVCERTAAPLGVLSVFQQYTTHGVDGSVFGTFALLYAASIPRAQLLWVCDKVRALSLLVPLVPSRLTMMAARTGACSASRGCARPTARAGSTARVRHAVFYFIFNSHPRFV